MNLCPSIPTQGDATLSDALVAIDCHLDSAVMIGYGRFFGEGGAFGIALRSLLAIYIALLALAFITGRTRLTLTAMTPRVMAFALVLTFATAWPAYQSVFYSLLVRGPDQIASAFMGTQGGATQAFAMRLDGLLGSFIELGRALDQQNGEASGQLQLCARLVWGSGLLLLFSTAGLLVVARIVLALLLALGPLFIVFALFTGTRGLFEGWLRLAVAFALVSMLAVLAGSAAMVVLSPMIQAIAEDPFAAASELRPIVLLFLGCAVYTALLLTMMWVAASLTRGWRPRGARTVDAPLSGADTASAAPAGMAQAATVDRALASDRNGAALAMDNRVSPVVSAVLREQARRIESSANLLPSGPGALQAGRRSGMRRGDGLGQTFRPPARHRPLTRGF